MKITQQTQKKARMGQIEEDEHGRIAIGVFEKLLGWTEFSKFISVICKFKYNARDIYFVCHEAVILPFTSNFFANVKFHSK